MVILSRHSQTMCNKAHIWGPEEWKQIRGTDLCRQGHFMVTGVGLCAGADEDDYGVNE